MLTDQIPKHAQRPLLDLSAKTDSPEPGFMAHACPRASQEGGSRGKLEDNRDKSKFILEAVTPNDIFTEFFNSSFDNVLSALSIFLKDESWLRVSSAR